MNSYAHILNGDGTAHPFKDSGLTGELIIWREMLMEGPVHPDVGSGKFNTTRTTFIHSDYDFPLEDYRLKVVAELEKIKHLPDDAEIVLWFEHDLFCQINMLAALSYLNNLNLSNPISLVSIHEHPAIPDFRGMGQLSPEHFKPLFENRKALTKQDIELADQVWKAYCHTNPEVLKSLTGKAFPAAFPYLKNALQLHFQRFANPSSGINQIQQHVLETIAAKPLTERQLIGEFLRNDHQYGLGDLQVSWWLNTLDTLIEKTEDIIQLNEKGTKVLEGTLTFQPENNHDIWIGGARFDNYYYDSGLQTKKL